MKANVTHRCNLRCIYSPGDLAVQGQDSQVTFARELRPRLDVCNVAIAPRRRDFVFQLAKSNHIRLEAALQRYQQVAPAYQLGTNGLASCPGDSTCWLPKDEAGTHCMNVPALCCEVQRSFSCSRTFALLELTMLASSAMRSSYLLRIMRHGSGT